MKLRRKHLLACLQAGRHLCASACLRSGVSALHVLPTGKRVLAGILVDLTDWLPLFWLD